MNNLIKQRKLSIFGYNSVKSIVFFVFVVTLTGGTDDGGVERGFGWHGGICSGGEEVCPFTRGGVWSLSYSGLLRISLQVGQRVSLKLTAKIRKF